MPSKFQRRHYEAIAEVIRTTASSTQTALFSSDELLRLAYKLADSFAQDNPAFDRDRFLAACGVSAPRTRGKMPDDPIDPRD